MKFHMIQQTISAKYSEISGQVEIYDASNINMRPAKSTFKFLN